MKKYIATFVLFLAGIAIGMVLHEQSNLNVLSAVSVQEMNTDQLNKLCQNSTVIKALSDKASQQEFKVSSIAATPIADRGLLCQVQGKLSRTLSGGRYSENTIERLVLISARSGDAEEITQEQFQYLQESVVIHALASNKLEEEPKK